MRHFEKYQSEDLINACKEKRLDTEGDRETLIARIESRGGTKHPEATPEPDAKPEA